MCGREKVLRETADDFEKTQHDEENGLPDGDYALVYSELETDLEQAGTSVKLFPEDQSILRALADPRRNPAGFYSRDFLTTAIYRIQRRGEATMQSHDHVTILL